jgi:hypothetical protein
MRIALLRTVSWDYSHGREVTCLQDCPDERSEGLGVLLSATVSTVHSLMPFLDTLLMLMTLLAPLTIPSGSSL